MPANRRCPTPWAGTCAVRRALVRPRRPPELPGPGQPPVFPGGPVAAEEVPPSSPGSAPDYYVPAWSKARDPAPVGPGGLLAIARALQLDGGTPNPGLPAPARPRPPSPRSKPHPACRRRSATASAHPHQPAGRSPPPTSTSTLHGHPSPPNNPGHPRSARFHPPPGRKRHPRRLHHRTGRCASCAPDWDVIDRPGRPAPCARSPGADHRRPPPWSNLVGELSPAAASGLPARLWARQDVKHKTNRQPGLVQPPAGRAASAQLRKAASSPGSGHAGPGHLPPARPGKATPKERLRLLASITHPRPRPNPRRGHDQARPPHAKPPDQQPDRDSIRGLATGTGPDGNPAPAQASRCARAPENARTVAGSCRAFPDTASYAP